MRGCVEPRLLTCERCGAPYLEGVTICYECGVAIGEDERPTHPVRIPVHLRARVTTALPAVRPGHAPVAADGPPASDQPSIPLATRPTRLTRAIQRFARAAPTHAQPLQLAFLAVSLVVFIAGVVVLSYRLIPSAVPAQAVYRDPAHRFTFTQPALWQTTTTIDGVRLTDSTGTSTVQITISAPEAGDAAAVRFASLANSLSLRALAPLVVAGATWQERSGQVSSANGVTYDTIILGTWYGPQFYTIEFSSPVTSFDATNSLVFQPLLSSFAFD
jgi:hypothetical protein